MKHAFVVVLVLAIAGAWSSAAGAVTPPSQDAFYDVPANISRLPNGTVLASRPVQVNAYSIPMPVHAWQVKYKTTDDGHAASADVATIMVPEVRWTGKGPRPLVSYQTAEDGISTTCAPSYGLRAGVTDDENNSGAEAGLMEYAPGPRMGGRRPRLRGPALAVSRPSGRSPRRVRRDQGGAALLARRPG